MKVPVPWGSTHLDRRPATLEEVARESIGLYASPPVSHLELAARVPGYSTADLDAAFAERRVIGLRTLRGSAFLMPVDMLPVVVGATRSRNTRAFGSFVRTALAGDGYESWADRVDSVLADGTPRTKRRIIDALDPPAEMREALGYAISQMATEARLVATREPSSWRSAANAFVRWDDWLPEIRITGDEDEARRTLARWYLSAWGPATIEDFSWWSGLAKTQARAALASCGAEAAGEWWRFGEPPDDAPPTGVRLLPIWDTLFVTWRDRARFLPDDLYPFVYDESGNATSVILADGRPVGVWTIGGDDTDLRIAVAAFDAFSSGQLEAIESEAEALGGLSGAETVRIVVCSESPRLRGGRRNLFMSPLRDHVA